MPSRCVKLFTHEGMLLRSRLGNHQFIGTIQSVLSNVGVNVTLCHLDDEEAKLESVRKNELTLAYNTDPIGANGLTFRRNYINPFWQIEASNERWSWPVAMHAYTPTNVAPRRAERFRQTLRHRVFKKKIISHRSEGYIYVPLQGRLLHQRSFQALSPLVMLTELAQSEINRPIAVSLHPGEQYSQQELSQLQAVIERFPNMDLSDKGFAELVASCEYIVCENSSVALWGALLGKPAVLGARIDFHHITLSLHHMSMLEAIERVRTHKPDYANYLWWFFQESSINARKVGAEDQIANRLRTHGW